MARTARSQAIWSLRCPEEAMNPKGAETWLESAVDQLGPFELNQEREGEDLPNTRELASSFVHDIAKDFNKQRFLARRAPRFKNVNARLENISRAAQRLEQALLSSDDWTRLELKHAGRILDTEAEFEELKVLAAVEELPKADVDPSFKPPGQWVTRLGALAKYCDAVRRDLAAHRQKTGRSPIDLGGNTNAYKEIIGPPLWAFVSSALAVYERFKPDQATGTIGGPFHCFVLNIFEYATGKDSSKFYKVDSCIKQLTKAVREDRALRLEQYQARSEFDALLLDRKSSSEEKRLARLDALHERDIELSRRRHKLRRKIWPHAYHYWVIN